MFEIDVQVPIKTPRRYEFRCVIRGTSITTSELLRRGKAVVRGYGSLARAVLRFGYKSHNFDIRHSELWDSFYPLMFLTRNGGPLFGKGMKEARIVFQYPILGAAKRLFTARAANCGCDIAVEGPEYERIFELPTNGHVLAFGGGKDSRMILGVLRELGRNTLVVTAGKHNVPDISGAMITTSLNGVLADRVMPALMFLGEQFYFGSGLGEAHREIPWQQYYDWGSPSALDELSRFMNAVGLSFRAQAPAAILPYNIIQEILFKRYPNLFRHQRSVNRDEETEKNLHVALCEHLHGISFQSHCNERLFRRLLRNFVSHQIACPSDFGARNNREPINREMRAIVWECRNNSLFDAVRNVIPPSWSGEWIHYIHDYVDPSVDPTFLSIYREYASTVSEAPPSVRLWRLPT